jgi:urease accessory protein
MLRATSILPRGSAPDRDVVDTITLDHQKRHRRRYALTGDGGLPFLLELERATRLEDGDLLRLDDGRLIRVRAAPEKLIAARARDSLHLAQLAWHIGNRHTPAEIAAETIYIAEDPVLADLLVQLGCAVETVLRPFRPESGAYAQSHAADIEGAGAHHHDHHHHDRSHHGAHHR